MNVDAIVRAGNTKLGKSIGKVSLPPGGFACPGASACLKPCYARKLERIYSSYKEMNARHGNLLLESPNQYFSQVANDIRYQGFSVVRIHESGDFFSVSQIDGWVEIAKRFPRVRFFAYTRSWKIAGLLPALERFRALSNVQLFASVDPDEPFELDWRTAKIVDRHATYKDVEIGSIICPQQTGKRASCADCGFCINPAKPLTRNVAFQLH